ncbi:TetR/AcrR family transcriptional regulator [Amycolatopsis sp. lyj-109]|uniref:TetR/AcrR family transcriptional regulator n=1 Tax=Amycolatopsis sp. lyj-109 TaxID=2789287 RepID=UPI003979B3BF
MTPKSAATRQRIVEGAAAEIRERGVAVTTLDDVRSRTGTSNSQLFHYFPDGKEELPGAQAVVTELLRRWQDEIEAGIRHLQRDGEVGADLDAGRAAAALLAGIQGGVVVMLSTGRIDHREAALDVGIGNLRASGNR